MADKKEQPNLVPAQGLEFTRASDHKVVYANNTRVGMSIWDVQIAFGQLDATPQLPPSHTAKVTDLVTIVVTPAVAKSLMAILGRVVHDYENAIGKIDLKPEFLEPMNLLDMKEKS